MPTLLRCPTCSAPLELTGQDADTAQCPYCGGAALISERVGKRPTRSSPRVGRSRRPPVAILLLCVIIPLLGMLGVFSFIGRPRPAPTVPSFTLPAFPEAGRNNVPESESDVQMAFGSEGTGAGRFQDSRAIATDGLGRIYVGEFGTGRVQVFDSAGTFLTQWIVDSEMPLTSLAADRGGTVYVPYRGRIRRYEGVTGKRLADFPTPRRVTPDDIVLGLDGTVYGTEGMSEVVHIGSGGELLRRLDVRALAGSQATAARVAVAGDGSLFVLDRFNGEIYRIAPSGRFVDRFGAGGGAGMAQDLAVDGHGRVLRAGWNGVEVFDPDGRPLGRLGSGIIFGLAVTPRDEILATQRNEHRVVKLRAFGSSART